MTPEQFAAKMRYISAMPADPERTRIRLIEAMADALENMGFKEGVRYFREVEEADE
jgi:hypothetical protein